MAIRSDAAASGMPAAAAAALMLEMPGTIFDRNLGIPFAEDPVEVEKGGVEKRVADGDEGHVLPGAIMGSTSFGSRLPRSGQLLPRLSSSGKMLDDDLLAGTVEEGCSTMERA